MIRKILFLFSIQSILFANAVVGQNTFQKSFRGSAYSYLFGGVNTFDEKMILVGNVDTSHFFHGNLNLIKIDQYGDILWSKEYILNAFDGFYSAAELKNHDLAATGLYYSDGIDLSMLYIRTDQHGNLITASRMKLPVPEYSEGSDVTFADDGSALVVGSYSQGGGNYKLYVVKIDIHGNKEWSATYDGANDWDAVNLSSSIFHATDGGFIMSSQSFTGGIYRNLLVVKINGIGDVEWSKISTDINALYVTNIVETTTGDFAIGFGSGDSIHLIKFDHSGNLSFEKIIPDSMIYPLSISATQDGGLLLNYWSYFNMEYIPAIVKLDSALIVEQGLTLKDTIHADISGTIHSPDGGYVLYGKIYRGFTHEYFDDYIVKTGSNVNASCPLETFNVIIENSTVAFVNYAIKKNTVSDLAVPVSLPTENEGKTVSTFCSSGSVPIPEWQVSPNPSNGEFQITGPFNSNATVIIYNMLGQIIFEQKYSPEPFSFSVRVKLGQENLGVYIVQVNSDSDYFRKKIFIGF